MSKARDPKLKNATSAKRKKASANRSLKNAESNARSVARKAGSKRRSEKAYVKRQKRKLEAGSEWKTLLEERVKEGTARKRAARNKQKSAEKAATAFRKARKRKSPTTGGRTRKK